MGLVNSGGSFGVTVFPLLLRLVSGVIELGLCFFFGPIHSVPSSNYPLIPLFVPCHFDFCLLRFFFLFSLPPPTVRCMRSGYRAVDSELRAGIWNQPPGFSRGS
jgi:hypothetical protein